MLGPPRARYRGETAGHMGMGRAGAPRKGNRPDEVEGGGTGQICFAGAALLCRAANPFREGLKVAAPVSSGPVAFPANERARPPLPPP